MRIAYVHGNGFPTVDANVVQVSQMCSAFASFGHEVTLFVPRAEKYATDAEALAAAPQIFSGQLPFKVHFVPRVRIMGRMELLGSVRSTLSALKQHPLDLVYTRNPYTVAFLPSAKLPYVFEVHEVNVHVKNMLLDRYLRSTIVHNSRKSSCALIVSISEALSKIWEDFGVPRSKLLSAHDAVDLSMFDITLTKQEARSRLSLSLIPYPLSLSPRPIVLYTGSLKPDRGLDLMLAAAKELPEMDFYFVGGKDEEIAHWKAEAARFKLDNAHFPGRVPHKEIPLWLAAADILLMMWTWKVPTIRGCSPMKMFEYMAADRLIVGPAFPTVCEVLESGKDSLLFEPDNLSALVSSLRDAQTKLTDSAIPAAARAKVASSYTWTARTKRILDALELRIPGFRSQEL
ncbi:MAG TPA: glycosyltransferase family 4 protein [bacterium]|jgi:glycosyltransferase involved in cell wall biosynthesis